MIAIPVLERTAQREIERAVGNARLDALERLRRAAQVAFRRNALNRRAIAHAFELELELNAVAALGLHAAG